MDCSRGRRDLGQHHPNDQPQGHTGLNVVENFDGIVTPAGSTSQWASDADADVGHDHLLEATNFSAAVYAKDGSVVMAPFPTVNFWSGFSAPCGGTWSDVIVLYDQEADRWFVSRFARQNPHFLETVGLEASVTDGPCPVPELDVNVYSDEDDVDAGSSGQFSPDAADIAPETLRLRAERVGMNDGRVYLIVISAADEAGGTGFATLTVTVPKSSSPMHTAAVEAQAAAAQALADANDGQPPPGYFLVGDGPEIGPKQS